MSGARILSWTPSVVSRPIEQAARAALAQTLVVTKGIAPKGASATMQPRRRSPSYTTMILKATGWGNILAPGAKPHTISPGAAKVERSSFSRKKGRTSRVRSKRGGKQAMAGQGWAHPVSGSVQHPGIKGDPYIEKGAAAFPSLFAREAGRRLPRG